MLCYYYSSEQEPHLQVDFRAAVLRLRFRYLCCFFALTAARLLDTIEARLAYIIVAMLVDIVVGGGGYGGGGDGCGGGGGC